MAILLNAHEISKTFGARPLFQNISFGIESGERIGLIGPNGAGKSTLLKIIAGQHSPDSGTLSIQKNLRIGFLEQVPLFPPDATILSAVMSAATDEYDWEEIARAQTLLAKLELQEANGLSDDTLVSQLSGGWRKRVALARELMRNPDLLLLDEPTNHLDVEGILWLEEYLAAARFATVTITHDRYFLQRISNRILELDRRNKDGLLSIQGDYTKFLEVKTDLMRSQELQETKLKNTLRREIEWLRQGAKARQTKQQARIQRAGDLKNTVSELTERNFTGTLRLDFQGVEKNPKKLVEALGIMKSFGEQVIIPKSDLLLTPKSRVALLGPNGCGKSTLIQILLKQLDPDQGTVFHSEHLQIAYFEQHRDSLDPETSLLRSICPKGDFVDFQGARVHVRGYLDRFLFRTEQHEMPVKRLSGGEQSRLLIAKLMLQPANILVLDEPTNDLDLATLDILAEVLQEFKGAVLLVTHDRFFLQQVANLILAFGQNSKGDKTIVPFAEISQWEEWHALQAQLISQPDSSTNKNNQNSAKNNNEPAKQKKKLSFKEERELAGMEAAIQTAEANLENLVKESENPSLASDAKKLMDITQKISAAQAEVDRLYARWTELGAS